MRVWRRVFENDRRGRWDGRKRSEQRQKEKNVVEDTFCVFVRPSSCLLSIAHFKLCCCTPPHLFCSPREPALSLSTFLSIFCEFKFTSSELVSNQNQLDPYHYLRLIPTHHPCVFWATRSPSGAGERPVQSLKVNHNEGCETRNRERPTWTRWRLPVVRSWPNSKICPVLTFQTVCGGCRENSLLKW